MNELYTNWLLCQIVEKAIVYVRTSLFPNVDSLLLNIECGKAKLRCNFGLNTILCLSALEVQSRMYFCTSSFQFASIDFPLTFVSVSCISMYSFLGCTWTHRRSGTTGTNRKLFFTR